MALNLLILATAAWKSLDETVVSRCSELVCTELQDDRFTESHKCEVLVYWAMTLHYLLFRAFCQATEDEKKVISAIKFVSGSEDFTISKSQGFHGNPILIIEAVVKSKKRIDSVFQSLGHQQLYDLRETLESRLDDEGNFFFRLDKQAAFEGRIVLTTQDDVIAVKGKVKAYPNNRDNAVNSMMEFLGGLLS
jgi:RNA-binding protein